MKTHILFVGCGILLSALTLAKASDLNGDGLPDLWQQQYSAFDVTPNEDDDGDNFNNSTEAIAGTDPFDATDYPELEASQLNSDNTPLLFSFPTKAGKLYQLSESEDLFSFDLFGPTVTGDSAPMTLSVDPVVGFATSGNVAQEFWANIVGNNITALTDLPSFPNSPDGETRLVDLDTPPLASSGFGFRLLCLITPPQTGDYSFFLSSGGSAQLSLSATNLPNDRDMIAQVLSGQVIAPNTWDTFEDQRSAPITLTMGQQYVLVVHAISPSPNSHCQVAWAGPDIDGIQIIDSSALLPYSPPTLLQHDYDSPDQQGNLVLLNTNGVVTAPPGMSGLAEQVTGDPSGNLEIFEFSPTTDHLYLSVLVNVGATNENLSYWLQGDGFGEDGPRIDFDLPGGSPAIRAGGSGGNNVSIPIDTDQTYRLEILTTIDTPFTYSAEGTEHTVREDTFDYYVSDLSGNLVGGHQGLAFRDGPGVVREFHSMRWTNFTNPDVTFDNWLITSGFIPNGGYIDSSVPEPPVLVDKQFFRLNIRDTDQDGDGLADSEELLLARHSNFLFFDPETSNGTNDLVAATNLINGATGTIEISLQASDVAAFEDNSPNIDADNGEIVISRTGPLTAVEAKLCIAPMENTGNTATICDGLCCTLVGSAGDEEAEVEDYTLVDEDGTIITDSVFFEFGEMTKTLTVIATKDTINEYPETLNLALYPDAAYGISDTINGASIQLFDLPDNPMNNAIFTGAYSQDGNAVVPSSGFGSTTAILNGPRTQLLLTSSFDGLTSNQQDAHIHKSNPGITPADRVGAIIYAITEVPGDETTDPLLGALESYPWDITQSSGAVPTLGGQASKQVVIDSLFGQNSETPLYLNAHTVDNPAGEIWSFLSLTGGSITDPGDADPAATPGSAEYPQLTGDDLESDVRRFLDQATFGATEDLSLIHI